MEKQKKSKIIPAKKITFDNILAVGGVLIAFIALFFSFQANQIAKEANSLIERQMTPTIEILWMRQSWWDKIGGNATQVGCDHTLRLYNPGSAPATISGHIAELSYRGGVIRLGSERSIAGVRHDLISDSVNLAESYFLTPEDEFKQRNSESPPPQYEFFSLSDPLNLPIQLEAFTAMDIVNRIVLTLGDILDAKEYTVGDPSYSNYDPTILENYAPIDLSITLILANGQTVASPRVTCLYLENP